MTELNYMDLVMLGEFDFLQFGLDFETQSIIQ